VDFFKFIEIINKYKKALVAIWVACALTFGSLLMIFPKKYKSSGSFAISGKYFLNPLVKEFLTETSDPSEMRAQKEALILGAISDSFIDSLGFQLGLYPSTLTASESPRLYRERAALRERIEIVLYSSSIQISVVDKSPDRAKLVLERIFETISLYLKNERKQQLESLRKSIKDQIDKLIAEIDYSGNLDASHLNSEQHPGRTAARLKLQNQLNEKIRFYKIDHPEIKKLQNQLKALDAPYLQEPTLEPSSGASLTQNGILGNETKSTQTIPSVPSEISTWDSQTQLKAKSAAYENLVVKYEYLNIALNNENSAASSPMAILTRPSYPLGFVSPNKLLFMMWGVLSALIFSTIFIALRESIFRHPLTKLRWELQSKDLKNTQPVSQEKMERDGSVEH
jgi:uncharacterized protein involved in exopolysaccharide biosynthesis